MKNPLTPAGIEPATFRFVAQHLNHWATAVPTWYLSQISGWHGCPIQWKLRFLERKFVKVAVQRRFPGTNKTDTSECSGKCDRLPVLHPSHKMRRCFTTKPWMLWRKQETSCVCSSSLFQGRTHASPQNCRNNQHTQPNYKQFCKIYCRRCNSVSIRRTVRLRVARHTLEWC